MRFDSVHALDIIPLLVLQGVLDASLGPLALLYNAPDQKNVLVVVGQTVGWVYCVG